jgi:hypothetical protein
MNGSDLEPGSSAPTTRVVGRRDADPREAELWRRLQAFELDAVDAALPFSQRLARENGWSRAFAQRAIDEYRRFVFLAMVAGHPVTPSDEVDQVWHLHLCYTRSYWDELCGTILPRPLHHGPTRGGGDERQKYDAWYRRTLASYRRVFGEAPPPAWWPSPQLRFAPRRWRRVDVGSQLVVARAWLVAAVALASLLLLPACRGVHVAVGIVTLVGLFGLGCIIWAAIRSGGGRGGGHGGCGDHGGYGCGGGRDGDSGCGNSGCGGSGCGGGGCGGGGCGGD